MGSRPEKGEDQDRFETNPPSDDHSPTNEHYETWFLGSLMRDSAHPANVFNRLSRIHNEITHDETNFDVRMQRNRHIASILSEFFPLKWLLESTSILQEVGAAKLGVKTLKDRICSFLGFIELYLTFRGLTLLDSTLSEIKTSLNLDITKNEVRSCNYTEEEKNQLLTHFLDLIKAMTTVHCYLIGDAIETNVYRLSYGNT